MRSILCFALGALIGCSSEETPRPNVDRCCPISETPACCMDFGGAKSDTRPCGMVCDNIPSDLVRGVDDAGCPVWIDPPGGTTGCNPSGPPDTGAD